MVSQPRSRMRSKSSAVSTPSAVTDIRKLLASWTIDWMIATFSGRVPASRAKPLQNIEGRAVVAEEHALGYLKLDPVAGHLVAGKRFADHVGQRRQGDLLG